ncbi:MAG: hypothetical protein COW48_05365 [Hydrogenophilales bacterium CG17_big_fil_post_rev_8_21_14_2_50_63_12]|nr:MAG: hypothetical protein COW48_05365 [Hydrogenophilales bacterium CG17_big_fil_post_rev_8_21_14_2_50_63_12]PIX97695.1 MAG: hypothetical protein COZ24_03830 [Hydrogenophilales bacterium CG_4_10_14_3_um_filter_63_21]PJB03657.1 MAG: hypothetical protein CO126_06360 [Hydrogenophilales bacterium CG_4_9_14_3_um_filter_63_34]
MSDKTVKLIPSDLLDFDPENPRFPRAINEGPIDKLIERMAREERIVELMESIGQQGYFPGEPLVAVKNGQRYIVAEGNRRLAAIKLLNGQLPIPSRLKSLQEAKEQARHHPASIPCLVFDDHADVLHYLGYRHITGVKAWRPLAKARYLHRLRQQPMYSQLSRDELLVTLAREIGSKPYYVGQMLTSLAVLEYAESQGFFGIQRIDPERLDFTVLSTALSYENIWKFIGLESRKDIDTSTLLDKETGELFTWLYAQREDNSTVVPESRELDKLAKVVAAPAALAELRESGDLEGAYRMTSGSSEALDVALNDARNTLERVFKLLGRHLHPTDSQENAAIDVADMARSIRNLIRDRREDVR